jgi:endoglucanase
VRPGDARYFIKYRPVFRAAAPGAPISPNLAGRAAAAFALGAQEDSWEDDLELGAVELALAARRLGDRRAAGRLRAAAHWAGRCLASGHRDALNLYDTSALAHADLVRALGRRRHAAGLEVGRPELLADLRRQLGSGAGPARAEPFGSAVDVTQFDAATRSFGFAATARLYRASPATAPTTPSGPPGAAGPSAPTPGARPS